MSIIALPDNNFRSVNWTLVQPTQVNRSEFTSARQVMQLPGASYFKFSAEHVPIRGEANIRSWRSFIAQLKGQANTFRLPVTEGPQHALTNPRVRAPASFTLANHANVTLGPDSLTKSTGTNLPDAAGYTSSTQYGPGVSVSFAVTSNANMEFVAGLADAPATSVSYGDIDQGVYCETGYYRTQQAGGLDSARIGTFALNDLFTVALSSSGKRWSYFRNGKQFLTRSTSTSALFGFDATLISNGTIGSINFGQMPAPSNTLDLFALPVSATLLPAGSLMTIPLVDGSEQLVVLTADLVGDSVGFGTATFEPMLRERAACGAPVETISPWARVAMDSPELGYSVDPGALYGFGFSATEAF